MSTNRAGRFSKPPPSIALNGRNEAGSPWGESPEWGTFMRHILGSQFAKLYAPNAVEKSVVQFSQPVQECIFFIPCRCSSFSSCTSLPLNKFRNLPRVEWAPVYHVKGWEKFNRHYGDFCTGADKQRILAATRMTKATPPLLLREFL